MLSICYLQIKVYFIISLNSQPNDILNQSFKKCDHSGGIIPATGEKGAENRSNCKRRENEIVLRFLNRKEVGMFYILKKTTLNLKKFYASNIFKLTSTGNIRIEL